MNHDAQPVFRHRGKSPRQAAYFFRSWELQFHAANLASLLVLYGLLRASSDRVEPSYRLGSLESGALLCEGYEAYRELHSPAAISFEHAWFLLLALGRRDEIALRRCAECGGLRVRDLLARHAAACPNCNTVGNVGGRQGSGPPYKACKHQCDRVPSLTAGHE
jgi:hypothetical protein